MTSSTALSLRISSKDRMLIDRAAEATHKSRTEFLLDSARAAATDALLDRNLFVLGREDFRTFEKALKAAEHALHLAPNCSLVLWHYAGALTMNVREFEALEVYEKMRTMDMDEAAYGEHGEGMRWAMQLMNDVHFAMGSLYHWLSEDEKAKISFGKYLHNRQHGVRSIYKIAEVKKYLADMEREPATKPYSANRKK